MVKTKVKCHGKEINGFTTEEEANSSCEYMTKQFQKEFYVYFCNECKLYHISPKDRQTRSFKSECLDSSGKPKQSYLTEKDALTRRDIIFNEQGKKLFIYKCDKCNYYHLTHKDFKNKENNINNYIQNNNNENSNNNENNNNNYNENNINTNSNEGKKKCIII